MNASADVTIYHNPECGTSRNTLSLIRAAGIEPRVIEYLRTPPDRNTLLQLLQQLHMPAADLLRQRGTPYFELGLDGAEVTDAQRLDAMLASPILINRPIVLTPRGAALCRPSDRVLELLPENVIAGLPPRKEDGSPLLRERAISSADAGLVSALLSALQAAGLPVDDLAEPGRHFFAYSTLDGAICAWGGLELYGQAALLRSLTVTETTRGQGFGGAALALLLRRAFDLGAREAWLLTTSAAAFFEQHGFRRAEREQAPASIRATRQFAQLCPASAGLLRRGLSL